MWVLAKVVTGFVEQKSSSPRYHIPLFNSATCWVRVERAELCFFVLWITHRQSMNSQKEESSLFPVYTEH